MTVVLGTAQLQLCRENLKSMAGISSGLCKNLYDFENSTGTQTLLMVSW